MKDRLYTLWENLYGDRGGTEIFFAPGRVNLLGEHTDWYGGFVLPCATDQGTWVIGRRRTDSVVRVWSNNFPQEDPVRFDLSELVYAPDHRWANYPKSIIWALAERDVRLPSGVDAIYWGNLPQGSGLSSSASIEVVTAALLSNLFGMGLMDDDEQRALTARLCQKAENDFIGIHSGIMDQFAVALSRRGYCLSLNCATLDYRLVPLDLKDRVLLLLDTGKRRNLISSQYDLRRQETERAFHLLRQAGVSVEHLADLSPLEFSRWENCIIDPVVRRRARHVVYESRRAQDGAKALTEGSLDLFGHLMNRSHLSLQFDYEITCRELDCLVAYCWQHDGCLGARMTGAGLGGSVVALVDSVSVDSLVSDVSAWYGRHTDCALTVSETGTNAGVMQMD